MAGPTTQGSTNPYGGGKPSGQTGTSDSKPTVGNFGRRGN